MKNVNFDLTFWGLTTNAIPSKDALSLSKCFQAYSEYCPFEPMFGIGFNSKSDYMYIALENGVTIGSHYGKDVEYIVCDPDTGEEEFLDSYDSAIDYLNQAHPMS